jgi:GAG-pre-integrase domain
LMSAVDSDGCVLRWTRHHQEFLKFVPINPKTGVPMFKSSPGYTRILKYMNANPELIQDDQVMCCQAASTIEDDNDSIAPIHTIENEAPDYPPKAFEGELTPKRSNVTIKTIQEHDKPVKIEFGDEDIQTKPVADTSDMDPTSEMLFLHYKLGHISFQKIRQLAKDGLVPKKFLKCRIPTCASCMYGTATKRPWRTKQPDPTQQNNCGTWRLYIGRSI